MLARTRSAAVEEEVQRLDATRRCNAIVNEKVTRSVQVTRPERIVEARDAARYRRVVGNAGEGVVERPNVAG
jgi:hypothetical protein